MNESLIKYLAGLLDADGSLSFAFRADENRPSLYFLGLVLSLSSSDAVDTRGFIDGLPELTGMGGVYRYGDKAQFKTWKIAKRSHLEMILPRLIKHMVIKGKHWNWLLNTWRTRRGTLSATERDELTTASKQSRNDSGPLKPKNHPTWAWLSGYLDGDGWYRQRYSKDQNYWSMHVGAVSHKNDVAVLSFLQKAFGGTIRTHGEKHPDVRVWVRNLGVGDRSFALRFLPHVVKHSRLKKHKIEQMIHFHRQRLSVSGATAQATV